MGTEARTGTGDLVARAHARLLADSSVQFHFTTFNPPKPPHWLIALGKFLQSIAPILKVLFWMGVAALVVFLVVTLARALVDYRRQRTAQGQGGLVLGPDAASLRPTAPRALALLEEADRLAAEQRFAEAAHVLLFRTIADLQARRPRALRPALTSRDIGRLEEIPLSARGAFDVIAWRVEHSFFGGRDLDAADFAACRNAYVTFASPASWGTGARA